MPIEATAMQAIPSPRPIAAHALVGGRLDADRRRQHLGEVALHLARGAVPSCGSSQMTRRVDVDDGPVSMPTTVRSSSIESASRQRSSVGGKCVPRSPSAGGAQEGVDDGVGDDVGVGVTLEPSLVLDLDAAEDERPPSAKRWLS